MKKKMGSTVTKTDDETVIWYGSRQEQKCSSQLCKMNCIEMLEKPIACMAACMICSEKWAPAKLGHFFHF